MPFEAVGFVVGWLLGFVWGGQGVGCLWGFGSRGGGVEFVLFNLHMWFEHRAFVSHHSFIINAFGI